MLQSLQVNIVISYKNYVTNYNIYRSCKTIFAKWSGTWLSRGSYGVYVAVTVFAIWLLQGLCDAYWKVATYTPYSHRSYAT